MTHYRPDIPIYERWWESGCIIQRSAAIDEAEASPRFAITAMVADATRDISLANTSSALWNIRGVEEGSFSVTPFYPKHFLVQCRS